MTMRTFCAALLLGMAGMGWGQQRLQCPKGQHPELWATLSSDIGAQSHGGEKCAPDKPKPVVPTSVTARALPHNYPIRWFAISKDDKCPDGYSKQWDNTGVFTGIKGETTYQCVEQLPCSNGERRDKWTCEDGKWVSEPKSLKCGKWEHIEVRETCDIQQYFCSPGSDGRIQHEHCAPDMHSLTEKEWQDLAYKISILSEYSLRLEARLKALESKGK